MDFIAVDVETANPDLASICQIGLAEFRSAKLAGTWQSLVDPQDYFDAANVSLHGIDQAKVRGQPTWRTLHSQVTALLTGRIVVSHTAFDRTSLQRVCEKYRLSPLTCTWLDSARVVRRTWTHLSRAGYGLPSVALALGIAFRHHNALEDARAAGEVLLEAVRQSGISVSEWLVRSRQPIWPASGPSHIKRKADPEGPLFGEVIAFTGAFSITRKEAADLAAKAGCEVVPTVGKKTTLLVIGDQDVRKLAGHEKSSKHRKAEDLIARGQSIRILAESDLQRLLALSW